MGVAAANSRGVVLPTAVQFTDLSFSDLNGSTVGPSGNDMVAVVSFYAQHARLFSAVKPAAALSSHDAGLERQFSNNRVDEQSLDVDLATIEVSATVWLQRTGAYSW
jgi:hypothetical protein